MEYEALMALIADCGGFNNVVRFVFDNNIEINFSKKPEETNLKQSDFIKLGGTWFFKEKSVMRSNDDYEYNVPMTVYHPLECLQSVITSTQPNRIDITFMNDMMAQMSS